MLIEKEIKTQQTPEVLTKWESLLIDVPDSEKEIVAWILENQERNVLKFSLTLLMKDYPRSDFESLESPRAMIENAISQYIEENFSRKEGIDLFLRVEEEKIK